MTPLLRGPITGPKAFAIFAGFFVVIIAANLVLAVQAVRTFSGLVVPSAYIASRAFEAERRAQEALGWTVRAAIARGTDGGKDEVVLVLTGPDGRPVADAVLGGMLRRPAVRSADQTLAFTFDGALWRAPVTAGPGRWVLVLTATAADGTPFRQHLALTAE
ncbi:putative integral membrane protein linked to a cation pump [Rubellimicrobium thermophilum DSM 16684]|uniref:Putative integral membrane protein linked to a cation pump n=1 Tax=Rubellimicrobium thermophilum DSM 16684 TaxID=1123069 RepID=S9R1K0_9RHOB|nr:FixH family protein [Rubellimicrobium thermophilum]EPX85767.1 putative integral membrane protein linked to a cation pump [Rubellimicrobium thermophilum DSM 16684]